MVGYFSSESRGHSLAEDTNLGVKQVEDIESHETGSDHPRRVRTEGGGPQLPSPRVLPHVNTELMC